MAIDKIVSYNINRIFDKQVILINSKTVNETMCRSVLQLFMINVVIPVQPEKKGIQNTIIRLKSVIKAEVRSKK